MELENEEEKGISVTPCTSSVRKNLLSRFENSPDSGFYSATPSSTEASYNKSIYNYSSTKSNSYFMTPSSFTEVAHHTPDAISEVDFYPRQDVQSSLFKRDDREEMMDLCCSPIIDDSAQKQQPSSSEVHEGTTFMDCEESLYYDAPTEHNLTLPSPIPMVAYSDINKSDYSSTKICGKPETITTVSEVSQSITSIESNLVPAKKIKSPLRIKHTGQQSKYFPRRKSLFGFERIDFFYFLGRKENHSYVISKILSYLSVTDLQNVTAVSKTWQQVCLEDLHARKRLELHRKTIAAIKENLKMESDEDTRRRLGPRSAFSQIQNLQKGGSPVKTTSPAASPRTRRFQLFCKEGEKLDEKSKLMPCPRCTLPAKCSNNGNHLGQCLCKNCQYRFCTACLLEYHFPKRCYRLSSWPRTKQSMNTSKKASKRRLSRL